MLKTLMGVTHLRKAVLTSNNNLRFGSKIRKLGVPLNTPVLLYKSGVQGGIYFLLTFFPDAGLYIHALY